MDRLNVGVAIALTLATLAPSARAIDDLEAARFAAASSFANLQMMKVRDVRAAARAVPAPPLAVECRASGSLLENISQGQACVADEQVGVVAVKGGAIRRYAVAVMDAAGVIRIVRVKQDRGRFDVLTPGVALTLRHENGINSDFQVDAPAGGVVLAVKYPLQEMPARVYTPYSPELATPEVIAEGLLVQAGFIDAALKRLRTAGARSRSFPGRLVADVVPRAVLSVLLMIEHINPDDFSSADQAEPLVNKVLVVLAGNKKLAYAHNISPAGARGLVQMMGSTYEYLLGAYPKAGLNRDFAAGAADPVNAVMSQILLCDRDAAVIKAAVDIPTERLGPYLAASYNGGAKRVIRAIANGQMAWLEAPDLDKPPVASAPQAKAAKVKGKHRNVPQKISKWNIFMPETMKYVIFYHWVQQYFEAKKVPGFAADEAPAK
jgi:hypothetical protein